jgi:hypothetical protein
VKLFKAYYDMDSFNTQRTYLLTMVDFLSRPDPHPHQYRLNQPRKNFMILTLTHYFALKVFSKAQRSAPGSLPELIHGHIPDFEETNRTYSRSSREGFSFHHGPKRKA